MHLQQHLGAQALIVQPFLHPDHGQLHDVGGRALYGHVDGHSLGAAPDVEVGAVDVGQVTAASQQGLDVLVRPGLDLHFFQIIVDAWVFLEVGLDERCPFLPAEARLLGYAMGRQAIDHAEVQHLGDTALFRVHLVQRDVEHH